MKFDPETSSIRASTSETKWEYTSCGAQLKAWQPLNCSMTRMLARSDSN